MQANHIKALSIKRTYAERIMSSTKKIELRKRPMGIEIGDLIILYETVPNSVIRGGFIADRTISLPVTEMWRTYFSILGVEKEFYDSYFENREFAYGTFIYQSFRFPDLSLKEIQVLCPGFTPPQGTVNWRDNWYVHPEWMKALNKSREDLVKQGRLTKQLTLFNY